MPDKDIFDDLKRSKEEEYFRKKEQGLIEKMRRQARLRAERQQLAEATGVADEEILHNLQELGYTRQTVLLLHLVPLLHVAWIDGDVTKGERRRIFELARARGIEEGSAGHEQLTDWLDHRPSDEFFRKTLRIIRDMLKVFPPEEQDASKRSLIEYCTHIATASGGILGLGRKVSQAEQALLRQVAAELEHDHQVAARQVVDEG